LTFARDTLSQQDLTEKELERIGAFQLSKHTKVFQDVYLKVGTVNLESTRTTNWEELLIQIRL
jgi:hypothetical protein